MNAWTTMLVATLRESASYPNVLGEGLTHGLKLDAAAAIERLGGLLLRAQRVISGQRTDATLLGDIESALGLPGEEKCARPDCAPCEGARRLNVRIEEEVGKR